MSKTKLKKVAWEGVVGQDTYQVIGENDSYGETAWAVRCWQERGDGRFEWVTVSAGADADAPECAAVAARIAEELAQAEEAAVTQGRLKKSALNRVEELDRAVTELEGRLGRVRGVVRAAIRETRPLERHSEYSEAPDSLCRIFLALYNLPTEDRRWAEEG